MQETNEQTLWESLSYAEKNLWLFREEKATLEMFMERRAITREQFEQGLFALNRRLGVEAEA